jgi:hypothetical protein
MNLRLALASAALAWAHPGWAQPVTGPYVSLAAGANVPYAVNYNYAAVQDFGDAPYAGPAGRFVFRPSYAGLAAIGYGFGDGVRIELGGDFLRATAHKDDKASFGDYGGLYPWQTRTIGGANTYGPMVNLLYDFPARLPLYPYLGAGAGYQWMKLSRRSIASCSWWSAGITPHRSRRWGGHMTGRTGLGRTRRIFLCLG